MADTKITALAAIATVDPAADVLPIVDISDTSMAASGTTKKVTTNQILQAGGTATLASATITGDLTVDTSTLKVDSTNNRVGIGTASPTAVLTVNGEISVTDNFALRLGSNQAGGATLLYNGSGNLDITPRSGFHTKLVDGNLIIGTSGKGIDFSATASGSGTMTSELLADYEEGTFTPTISSGVTGITFGTQTGSYTKVGRLVSIVVQFTTTGSTRNGSPLIFAGLPFAATSFSGGVISYSSSGFIATAAGNKPNLLVSGSTIEFYNSDGTAFNGTTIAANIFDVRFSATYSV
jgi:hypothetical protein